MKTFNLNLTEQQLQTVFGALVKLPFEQVYQLVQAIEGQVQSQLKASEGVPVESSSAE